MGIERSEIGMRIIRLEAGAVLKVSPRARTRRNEPLEVTFRGRCITVFLEDLAAYAEPIEDS